MKLFTTFRIPLLAGLAVAATGALLAQSPYSNPAYIESELPPNVLPPQLKDVGVEEKLGSQVDLDLEFIGEDGYPVKLKEFFKQGRPVILNLVYYECPQLCTLILNAQTETMRSLDWTPGEQYEVVTISIDPRESFDDARKKKAEYLASYDRPAPGWHFLADTKGSAKILADQVGFNYVYDKRLDLYAHASAIMVLTPEGKMARYLYGISYRTTDLRFALAEASQNRATVAVEKILLFCYQYDPESGRYVLFATNFMMAGGVLTMLALGWFWWSMVQGDRRRMAQYKERTA